jgi:cyclin A
MSTVVSSRVVSCLLQYPSLSLEFMGSYLSELSLLEYGCVRFLPSVVAASAVFVARLTLNPDSNPWVRNSPMPYNVLLLHYVLWNRNSFWFVWLQSKKLQSVTGYRASELKDCITTIHDLQLSRKGQSWNAVRDKYKQHRVIINLQSQVTYLIIYIIVLLV